MTFLFYGVIIPTEIYIVELLKIELKEKKVNYDKLSNKEIMQLYLKIKEDEEDDEESNFLDHEDFEKNPINLILEYIDHLEPKELHGYVRYLEENVLIDIKIKDIPNNFILDPLEFKQEDINKLNNILKKYNLDSFLPKLLICSREFPDTSTKVKEGKDKI